MTRHPVKALLVLTLVLTLLAGLGPAGQTPLPASAQDPGASANRDTILRLVNEGYNQGEIGVIDEIFAPTFTRYPVATDLNGIKFNILALRAAMPDLQATPVLLLAEGNRIALSLSLRGKLVADLVFPDSDPIPATGEMLDMVVNSVFVLGEGHVITEEWTAFDNLSFLANIGLLEQIDFWNAPSDPVTLAESTMTSAAHDMILNYYDALNRGDFEYMQARLVPDFVGYNPFGSLDRDGYIADWQTLYNALSNFNTTLESTAAEGDWVAAVYTLNGIFDRNFTFADGSSVPPTNGPITLTLVTFHQFDEQGQLRQTREIYDGWSLLAQIKLVTGDVPGG